MWENRVEPDKGQYNMEHTLCMLDDQRYKHITEYNIYCSWKVKRTRPIITLHVLCLFSCMFHLCTASSLKMLPSVLLPVFINSWNKHKFSTSKTFGRLWLKWKGDTERYRKEISWVTIWSEFMGFWTGITSGFCKHGDEPIFAIKLRKYLMSTNLIKFFMKYMKDFALTLLHKSSVTKTVKQIQIWSVRRAQLLVC
jgi:hypothetical protein